MASTSEHTFDTLPTGRLGIIALNSSEYLGTKIDDFLVGWRNEREYRHKEAVETDGYHRASYLIDSVVPRFGSGEAKGIINESVRGDDIYILVDICNYSLTYWMRGKENRMSPDDHFQDLKRIIAAVGGKARRINVIMP